MDIPMQALWEPSSVSGLLSVVRNTQRHLGKQQEGCCSRHRSGCYSSVKFSALRVASRMILHGNRHPTPPFETSNVSHTSRVCDCITVRLCPDKSGVSALRPKMGRRNRSFLGGEPAKGVLGDRPEQLCGDSLRRSGLLEYYEHL